MLDSSRPNGRHGGGWVERVSARGYAYKVWVPAVPRIADQFLQCVVYVYPDLRSAEAGESIGGTGFLVGIPLSGFENVHSIFVVTNAHNIRNGGRVVRLNTSQRRDRHDRG
jgi:hypothetical protein